MEYMIILGIVSAVLLGMNVYVKRNVQGKVKDLTDTLIGKGQETEISRTATTTSSAVNDYESTIENRASLGGGWRVESQEDLGYTATSEVKDTDVPYTEPNYTPAQSGYPYPEPVETPSGT